LINESLNSVNVSKVCSPSQITQSLALPDTDEVETACTEIDKESEKLTKESVELEKEREKRETQQADDQRNIARQQKSVERYLAKRQILMQRKDDCNKNIRDLGVLPEEAFIETTASSEKVGGRETFTL